MYLVITITVMAVLGNVILPAKIQTKPTADGILLPKVEAEEVGEAKTGLEPLKPVPVPEVVQTTAEVPKPVEKAPVSFGGNCESWIAAAGITDLVNARELIRRESGCNPYAVNNSSGACGVAQELPCGKSGCQFGNGACQIRWMQTYVLDRYGSWSAAVAFHNQHNYY